MKSTKHSSVFRFIGRFCLMLPIIFILFSCSNYASSSNNSSNNSNYTPGKNEVWMQNTSYNPDSLSVSMGTTVTWTNKDQINHTVTSGVPGSPNGIFDSGTVSPGKTFTFTFDSVGTFKYYCKIHLDRMTGVVSVH